jgi:hypothetical protein
MSLLIFIFNKILLKAVSMYHLFTEKNEAGFLGQTAEITDKRKMDDVALE